MELCKSKASITVQMFCESVKIAGRAAVAATVSLSWENQKPGSIYERHSFSLEGFHESLSFPRNLRQYLKKGIAK